MNVIKKLSFVEKTALMAQREQVEKAIGLWNRILIEIGLDPADPTLQFNWEASEVARPEPESEKPNGNTEATSRPDAANSHRRNKVHRSELRPEHDGDGGPENPPE